MQLQRMKPKKEKRKRRGGLVSGWGSAGYLRETVNKD